MHRLRESQESVGRVLRRGQALAKSGRLANESTAIVHKQISVVNDKWETLRALAMERQAKLHEHLMRLQQSELDDVIGWLTQIERIMDDTPALGSDESTLIAQSMQLKVGCLSGVHLNSITIWCL
jgi:hypothetical protein